MLLLFCSCGESSELLPGGEVSSLDYEGSVYNCVVLNSSEDEFAPVLTPDGQSVLITSTRAQGTRDRMLSPEYLYGEAVYESRRTAHGPELKLDQPSAWSPPVVFRPGVMDRVNTGAVALDAERGEMYLSATYLGEGMGGADIFISSFLRDEGKARPLENVNSHWWDAHPAVSPDGKMLVFASDRVSALPSVSDTGRRVPKLWMSIRDEDNGSWSVPRQLPEPVNSDAAEMSPHFDADGTLYFATARWPEVGFEIVRSRNEQERWTLPERLPAPINSAWDDCFPFVTSDRMHMIFASNRPGGMGGYDIWCAELPYCLVVTAEVTLLDEEGTMIDVASDIPIEVVLPETNKLVLRGRTDERGVFVSDACLKPNTRYMLYPGTRSCFVAVEGTLFETHVPRTLRDTIHIASGLRRQPLPQFHVVSDSIPFFVTGYWYPNTTRELARLRERLTSIRDLPNANFIDTSDYDYDWAAERVDTWFTNLYEAIERMLVPVLDSCYGGTDTLLITVVGYVDPRGLVWGKYDESAEVRTLTTLIRPGTVMQGVEGNQKLSHLRAHFAKSMIESHMLQRSDQFRMLREQRRVLFHADGGHIGYGISGSREGPINDPLKRKFTVNVEILRGK